jgi:DNA polymerase-3 subunit gamma/tau
VARRYRPQTLDDLVGQEHVVAALRNAIRLNRITHAYLFTGTRGVGKTSMARIFAKCLNCEIGPTDKPCNQCDTCRAISVGQDVDVIEIDGASNTGVDSVRELRANVGLRPSRSRFKIYYIDEVHMLSTGAFNALLKTLEEPPEHVKFFFATTESQKIPITVLSRCQRFDFAGITPEKIVETLDSICHQEAVEVEKDALWTVARRAGGSMRDAQSLLERLLTHSEGCLTDDQAREILGLASDDRMLDLLESAADHDLARLLEQIEAAMVVGVQPGDLVTGVLELLRDAMVQSAGSKGPLMAVGSRQKPRLEALAQNWGMDSILAAMQIMAETKARMKGNPQGRLLAELGLARVTRLDRLSELSDVIARIKAGGAPAPAKRSETSAAQRSGTVTTQRITAAPAASEILTSNVAEERREPLRPAASSVKREETVPRVAPKPEPALEKSSSPTASTRGDLPNLENIRNRWEDFVGKIGMRLGTVVAGYPPKAFSSSGEMICEVPLAFDKMAEQFALPENVGKIEEASKSIWSQPLGLQVVVTDRAESVSKTESEKTSKWLTLEQEPVIKTLVDMFQARRFWIDQD